MISPKKVEARRNFWSRTFWGACNVHITSLVQMSLIILGCEMRLSMHWFTGSTFGLISRKQEVKFPTLFFVETSKSHGLWNEVLYARFDCQNVWGSVNLPNFGSVGTDQFEAFFSRIFLKLWIFYSIFFSAKCDRMIRNWMPGSLELGL